MFKNTASAYFPLPNTAIVFRILKQLWNDGKVGHESFKLVSSTK
jgi:hypothetical protein